ncbi:hypothetical protein [Pseudaestuariivita rosea]|uniref:hypothetical protein n=1 Tax=Pseudaestuariivita rosea TaxID=2763263 RepID=UPI001ABAC315|nr:hypothetical protein [Pseudaestuariivita rosea]
MDDDDKRIFPELTFLSRANVLLEKLKHSFSFETDNETYREAVLKTMYRMHEYGLRQKQQLEQLVTWGLFYGSHFEEDDPDGRLLEICLQQDLEPLAKFTAFSKRLRELH